MPDRGFDADFIFSKVCSRCGERKKKEEFYKKGRSVRSECKECSKIGFREYGIRNNHNRYLEKKRKSNPTKQKNFELLKSRIEKRNAAKAY